MNEKTGSPAVCYICNKPVDLTFDTATEENGKAVHELCYLKKMAPPQTPERVSKTPMRLDYARCPKCDDPVPLWKQSTLLCTNSACKHSFPLDGSAVVHQGILNYNYETMRWKAESPS
jgi:hypothetical protein